MPLRPQFAGVYVIRADWRIIDISLPRRDAAGPRPWIKRSLWLAQLLAFGSRARRVEHAGWGHAATACPSKLQSAGEDYISTPVANGSRRLLRLLRLQCFALEVDTQQSSAAAAMQEAYIYRADNDRSTNTTLYLQRHVRLPRGPTAFIPGRCIQGHRLAVAEPAPPIPRRSQMGPGWGSWRRVRQQCQPLQPVRRVANWQPDERGSMATHGTFHTYPCSKTLLTGSSRHTTTCRRMMFRQEREVWTAASSLNSVDPRFVRVSSQTIIAMTDEASESGYRFPENVQCRDGGHEPLCLV
jgi:hypothetical protein